MFQEIKSREEQEFLRDRKEDEMEMSDSEAGSGADEPSSKKKRTEGKGEGGRGGRMLGLIEWTSKANNKLSIKASYCISNPVVPRQFKSRICDSFRIKSKVLKYEF